MECGVALELVTQGGAGNLHPWCFSGTALPDKGRAGLPWVRDSPALSKRLDKRSPEVPPKWCFYDSKK